MSNNQLPCCYPMLQPNAPDPVIAVWKLTNWVRKQHGVMPLRLDLALNKSAQSKSEEMFWRKYFDHANPEGKKVPGVGENIARGYINAYEVMEAWRLSKGHHDNMNRPHYTRMGVGVVLRPNSLHGTAWRWFWTQHFGI